ncbi:MAG: deoxyribonuclease IV [Candidatus Methylarchaceae archaeon HK02M1]|nr:deoxyribonuclease IV [Candidatus Methylarchaceae archaeon HK02M1]
MLIGTHVSIAGSIDKAVDRAEQMKCKTFQIFTRNPRGWKFAPLNQKDVDSFIKKLEIYGFSVSVAHMPYLPNISSPSDDVYKKSVDTLKGELLRCGRLRINYLVTHLGSHLGKGLDVGMKRAADACNQALSSVDNNVMLLLENTAGAKNSVGSNFECIISILDQIEQRDRVGVCFDTCHAFAAGYDLRNKKAVNETLNLFDKIIDLSKLKVVHINDSKGRLNSYLDRHEHIGIGFIGEEGFRAILAHKVIRELPLILETPIDGRRDSLGNLKKVRELFKD